jgi:membrane associated rhomboid family serine protease
MPLLAGLIGLNVVVYFLWWVAPPEFMGLNFLVSREHLAYGYYWTLLTAEFSHKELWHLLMNMITLRSFGSVLVSLWGSRRFIGFYLAAAVVASLAHVGVGFIIGRENAALGASGAVSAALAAFAFLYPRQKILLFGAVPLPAYVAVLLFVGLDVWGVVAQSAGGGLPIGHGAHLGGAAFGLAYAMLSGRRAPLAPSDAQLEEIDRLLAKARAGGVESLSPEEHAFLQAMMRDRG